jgi:hypothetical protein
MAVSVGSIVGLKDLFVIIFYYKVVLVAIPSTGQTLAARSYGGKGTFLKWFQSAV